MVITFTVHESTIVKFHQTDPYKSIHLLFNSTRKLICNGNIKHLNKIANYCSLFQITLLYYSLHILMGSQQTILILNIIKNSEKLGHYIYHFRETAMPRIV